MSPESSLVENIFLGIFLFGLIFTIASVVLGFAHVGTLGGHHAAGGSHGGTHASGGVDSLSVMNMPTIMAFLTWFGGAGYIVVHTLQWSPVVAVPLALASGWLGGWFTFILLARVLWPLRSEPMDSEDYSLPGTHARVVSSIREGGVGEIVYSKEGSRFTAGARAVDNQPIAKGADVVIIEYEHGLAYVDPVEDLAVRNLN